MLDIKFVRSNLDAVKAAMARRGAKIDLDGFTALDARRRELLAEVEALKGERNAASGEVARLKRSGGDASGIIGRMGEVGERIKALDEELRVVDEEVSAFVLTIPNIPHATTPDGRDENDNPVLRHHGEKPAFDGKPLEHWEIGARLGALDFDRAAKLAGSRFAVLTGPLAKLERALISLMLDLHTVEHGYLEVLPPFIANSASLTGTGQLPKFAAELFKLEGWDYYLIPTAEVPLTNLHRGEILREQDLPIAYTAYTPCFRSEAGSYGKDAKGLIRQHQFDKIELVRFVKPESSYDELEKLTGHAEEVLRRLGLHYRVIALCAGDLGFGSAKTYDLEVWMPGQDKYREISSCSNFEAFQARRADIRFKPAGSNKNFPVHTLNGSGLAVGRTLAAILENYADAEGNVTVPGALRPYMGRLERIEVKK
ncbi:MAG: serine--tRNA ligase [Desulfovibrionaceae bacterium]|nr:serine--tRNA ligase [Desulfovibrionaceae bacterium]MBF0513942.1 serine--tRNA ligase [Desulfovibrionaceae bacterium]